MKMNKNKSCLNCRFFDKDTQYEQEVTVCKRYAPRRIHGVGTGSEEKRFPIVSSDEWCGEWEAEDEN